MVHSGYAGLVFSKISTSECVKFVGLNVFIGNIEVEFT